MPDLTGIKSRITRIRKNWWRWGQCSFWTVCTLLFLVFAYLFQAHEESNHIEKSTEPSLLTILTFGIAWFSLCFTFDQSVLREHLRKPRLKTDPQFQYSLPTKEEEARGVPPSIFLRLCVSNWGKSPARNCVGRLLEVHRSNNTKITVFDPLPLYWARQSEPEKYQPKDIYGHGDYEYLDVAQATQAGGIDVFKLRICIPDGHRLASDPEYPNIDKGILLSDTYFLKIGVFEEGEYYAPEWFKLSWENEEPTLERVARKGNLA